ncbi:PASTA domain-containing protein [Streptococcus sp. zg-86]|uniref:PASTA domain-containing protein n=1 Tax=Streptococcus zhangguiae TaxID=2664091 RepID=A0A6I4RFC3_9STRE|nr:MULTISPECIES: PASTA domain-containing protein [Streptococcus]MTB63515.1 PASTA domain-containing protein [Streptococcus sp. zg-86]MTB89836.1 PASTA domain-containing protein [Streptococcus sp. zg-36]MWV55507.1 PASTA domain-containing protein [Streptococcus sp. zg-70]QTH47697.1 PASTA domain-containing protein [Streptococcus sp. zg-86]
MLESWLWLAGSAILNGIDHIGKKEVPNVIELDLAEAKKHLTDMGFRVSAVLLKPERKYAKKRYNEVVDYSPGWVEKKGLVKIYYVDEEVVEASKKIGFFHR